MNDYPRQDKKIQLYLSDKSQIAGLINIAGRGTIELVEDAGPDIVLYSVNTGDGELHQTILVAKHQIVCIDPLYRSKDLLDQHRRQAQRRLVQ